MIHHILYTCKHRLFLVTLVVVSSLGMYNCKSTRELTVWSGFRFLSETNVNTGGGAAPHRPARPVHRSPRR